MIIAIRLIVMLVVRTHVQNLQNISMFLLVALLPYFILVFFILLMLILLIIILFF